MKNIRRGLLALAACAGLAGLAPIGAAQDSSNQHIDSGSAKMLKSPDAKFAMKAAQGGLAEVKMGQLAADKATNPAVKAFGQQMVDDHTKANNELKSVAESENMTLPTDVSPKEKAMYDKLSAMSGSAFDKAYVNMMVKDHEEDVKEFQKEASSGTDPKIKDFASTTLPTLQGHLSKIKTLHASMSSGKSSM